MRNTLKAVALFALCFFISAAVQAQEKEKDKDKYKPGTEKDKDGKNKTGDGRSDKDMNAQLTENVYSRNPAAKDAVIVWDNHEEGYDGTYAVRDVKYMTRYDKEGNYVETLVERKWDNQVPSNVKRAFDSSPYKSNRVERFWEVNEDGRQGYYLEIKDDDGNSRRIWSDRDGKFSEKHHMKRDN